MKRRSHAPPSPPVPLKWGEQPPSLSGAREEALERVSLQTPLPCPHQVLVERCGRGGGGPRLMRGSQPDGGATPQLRGKRVRSPGETLEVKPHERDWGNPEPSNTRAAMQSLTVTGWLVESMADPSKLN